jgi:hypothetical protein
MRFAGTKRAVYTKQKVKELRSNRIQTTPKKEGVSSEQVQNYLGKLQAAGHMKIDGFRKLNIDSDIGERGVTKTHTIEFNTYAQSGMEDKPHVTGYLTSAHDNDKQYRLKGWFNEDGVLRIEIVY